MAREATMFLRGIDVGNSGGRNLEKEPDVMMEMPGWVRLTNQ
jgi:hypothetical protein